VSSWHGPLWVSKRPEPDCAVTDIVVDFVPASLYWERHILIEAFETWLADLDKRIGFRGC